MDMITYATTFNSCSKAMNNSAKLHVRLENARDTNMYSAAPNWGYFAGPQLRISISSFLQGTNFRRHLCWQLALTAFTELSWSMVLELIGADIHPTATYWDFSAEYTVEYVSWYGVKMSQSLLETRDYDYITAHPTANVTMCSRSPFPTRKCILTPSWR